MDIPQNSKIDYNQDLVEKTKKAYEKTSQDYIEKHAYTNEMKAQADFFIDLIKSNKETKILDAGCGPGRDAEYFSKRGLVVYGIDLVKEFVQKSKERVPEGIFSIMDMRNMSFENDYFDGVWNCTALMHLPNPEKAMKEHYRILKPNGILYISVLNKPEDSMLTGEKYGDGAKFFRGYTGKSLSDLVIHFGFEILNLKVNPENRQNLNFIDIFAKKL